ncbi:hypothetical protein [Sphingomonas sp. UYP23]
MRATKQRLRPDQRDAYFQLVEHPIEALGNLYHLYYAVAWNRRLAAAADARANSFANQAEAAFARDAAITEAYHALNGRKWDGMMAQTHIGYTSWQQPDRNVMPAVTRVAGAAEPIRFVLTSQSGDAGIAAADYTRAVGGRGLTWRTIAHLGRSAAVVALPQGAKPTTQADGVRLEYAVSTRTAGRISVKVALAPTLDVTGSGTLRLGISLDDGPMRTLEDDLTPAPNDATSQAQRDWNAAVESNIRELDVDFPSQHAGSHIVKIWRLDDDVVLERLHVRVVPD